jgi:hypothetical protein
MKKGGGLDPAAHGRAHNVGTVSLDSINLVNAEDFVRPDGSTGIVEELKRFIGFDDDLMAGFEIIIQGGEIRSARMR